MVACFPRTYDSFWTGVLIPPMQLPKHDLGKSRLVQAATSLGRPDVAAYARTEWEALQANPAGTNLSMTPEPVHDILVLSAMERIERVVFRTLPCCCGLLLITGLALRFFGRGQPATGISFWILAIPGLIATAILVAGDLVLVFGARAASGIPFAQTLASPDGWSIPALAVVMPPVLWTLTGLACVWGGLVSASIGNLWRTGKSRAWTSSSSSSPNLSNLILVVTFRAAAWFSLWLPALCAFFWVCWSTFQSQGVVVPFPYLADFGYWIVIHPSWILLSVVFAIVLPWWLAPAGERREMRAAARTSIQSALLAYLVAATLICGGLEMVRIPSQLRVNATVERVIQNGG